MKMSGGLIVPVPACLALGEKLVASRRYFILLFALLLGPQAFAADLKGEIVTADGTPLCGLAIASGRSMFTCSPRGPFSFQGLPLEKDGTIRLQVFVSGFFPSVTVLEEFDFQRVVMEPATRAGAGGPVRSRREQTERLIGDWLFEYTIISTFQDFYTLVGPAEQSPEGDYFVFGLDSFNNADVSAAYFADDENFSLLDRGSLIDQFYIFNFVFNGQIAGCYYQVEVATEDISPCFPLLGFQALEGLMATFGEKVLDGAAVPKEQRLLTEVEAHGLAAQSLLESGSHGAESLGTEKGALDRYKRLRSLESPD